MLTFVDQAQKVNRLTLNLVVDVERKRLGSAAGKAVRADMVAAAPANDLTRLPSNAFVESVRQPVGNFAILFSLASQVIAKPAAENRLHSGWPKTSGNVSPES